MKGTSDNGIFSETCRVFITPIPWLQANTKRLVANKKNVHRTVHKIHSAATLYYDFLL